MTDPFAQHRRHRRVAVHVPVRVSTIDPETDPVTGRPYFRDTREYAANVSRGGAFIQTNDPPQAGRRVLVQIHLPEGDSIEAVGRVAWSRRVLHTAADLAAGAEEEAPGAGLEFNEGDPALDAIGRALDLPEDDDATD